MEYSDNEVMSHVDVCLLWERCVTQAEVIGVELDLYTEGISLAGVMYLDIDDVHKALMVLEYYKDKLEEEKHYE